MTEEQELARRLHLLVDQVPAGRNLVPEIRKAHARRRVRVAAVGTSLGVTGVASVGALALSAQHGSPGWVGPAPTASASPFVADTLPHPTEPVLGDATATIRSAPYWFQRTIAIGQGRTSERLTWMGRRSPGYLEQRMPPDFQVKRLALGIFEGDIVQPMSWDDFSSTLSSAAMQRLLYGPEPSSAADRSKNAFGQGGDLLFETPTTQAFRLTVLAALKTIPGVVVKEGVRDAVGRAGVQLARDDERYVIDPSDGRLLQRDSLAGNCPGGVQHVESRNVLLEFGPINSDEAVPAASPVALSDEDMGCPGGAAPSPLQASAAAATSAVAVAATSGR